MHPFVLIVGEAARSLHHARGVMATGAIVVLAPTIEAAREWMAGEAGTEAGRAARELAVGDLIINRSRHEVRANEVTIPLTEREVQLLDALSEEPGRVWSFGELLARVWGMAYLGDSGLVHAAVRRLRAKLANAGSSVRILAVRGAGFRLDPGQLRIDGAKP